MFDPGGTANADNFFDFSGRFFVRFTGPRRHLRLGVLVGAYRDTGELSGGDDLQPERLGRKITAANRFALHTFQAGGKMPSSVRLRSRFVTEQGG